MISNRLVISAGVGIACLVAATSSPMALAEEAGMSSGIMEELVVTARKREESFIDVPTSMALVTAEQLDAYDTQQLTELQYSVPNMYVQQTNSGKQMSVRGLGNVSINQHFDQAVGFAVDGLSLQRSQTFELGYFDVERVEVLRGPQGSYFGRNTTAGLINVTTKGPTDEFEGSLTVGYEDETEEALYKFSVSGPISEDLGGRLALQYRDSEGWMSSTESPFWRSEQPAIKETLGRLTLEWTPSDNVLVTSKSSFTDFAMHGTNVQFIDCSPAFHGFMGAALALGFINNVDDCEPDDRRSGSRGHPDGFNGGGDDERTFEGFMQSVTVEWELANEYMLVSVTGYQDAEMSAMFPASWYELIGSTAATDNEFDDFSQEFRLMSPEFDWGSYVAGVFYNTSDYRNIQGVDFILTSVTLGLLPFDGSSRKEMNQDQKSYAIFGEVMWDLSEDWRLTLGGRYTRDEKDFSLVQTLGPLGSPFDSSHPAISTPFIGITALTSWEDFILEGSDDYSDFTPSVTLEWNFSDNGSAYVSYKEGFKSGGFDQGVSSSGDGPELTDIPPGFSFDPEETQAIEVGLKLELPEQNILLSAAVFHQGFTDLQVQGYEPGEIVNPNLITRNAADSTSEGIELDMIWQATDRLRINAALAYLDATYDEYTDSPCYGGQTEATGCFNRQQDLSGETLVLAPKRTASLGFIYDAPLGDSGLELEIGGHVGYRSEVNVAASYQPGSQSDALTMVNASIAVKGQDDRWVVRLIGRNLLDEAVLIHHQVGGAAPGSFIGAINPPRRVQAQFTFNF